MYVCPCEQSEFVQLLQPLLQRNSYKNYAGFMMIKDNVLLPLKFVFMTFQITKLLHDTLLPLCLLLTQHWHPFAFWNL